MLLFMLPCILRTILVLSLLSGAIVRGLYLADVGRPVLPASILTHSDVMRTFVPEIGARDPCESDRWACHCTELQCISGFSLQENKVGEAAPQPNIYLRFRICLR
jgi:hypothetical protein